MRRYWAQSGDWNDQSQWVPGTYRLTIEAPDIFAATAEVDRRLAQGDHRCFDCGSAVRVFSHSESSWRPLDSDGNDAGWSRLGNRP
jgi:hypothetical protein